MVMVVFIYMLCIGIIFGSIGIYFANKKLKKLNKKWYEVLFEVD